MNSQKPSIENLIFLAFFPKQIKGFFALDTLRIQLFK